MNIEAIEIIVEDHKQMVLSETDLDRMYKLGIAIQAFRTEMFKSIENGRMTTEEQGANAMIGMLRDIWKDRKDLMVAKAKHETEPSVQFNKKFRHFASQMLSKEVYKSIQERATKEN
jgi:hypothetical protein